MSIVREFEKAFKNNDMEALIACFTPDATYHDTFLGGLKGPEGIRTLFERTYSEGRDYAWTMDTVVETDDCAAAEWTFTYVVSDAIPRSAGRRVSYRGMGLFEKKNGRICAYRESLDLGVALLQLGFSPEATIKTLRKHRKIDV